MIRTYLLSIIRNLWKNRVTSAINVLGLTLGLSSILFIYVQNRYESTFDTHQPRANDIYRVNVTIDYPNRLVKTGNSQSMLVKAIRNEFPDLEAAIQITGPNSAPVSINPGKAEERVFEEERTIFYADSVFLKYFDYDFIAGNPRTALDNPNSLVLSSQLVEKYYPDFVGREIELLGQEIAIYDSLRTQITGVISSIPNNSNFPFELLISADIYYKLNAWDKDNWSNLSQGLTFVVLAEGQKPEDIDRRFPDLVNKYRSEEYAKITSYSLLNLKKVHGTDEWGFFNGNYTTPKVMDIGFKAIGLFILLSACINFINLQTAQSVNRAREVSIRKVLGGNRSQLILQFLVETAILTTVSFLFALWITELAIQSWNSLLTLARMDLQLDWSVVTFGLILIGVVTLIAGLYPAIKLSSFQPSEALKSGFSLLETKKEGLNTRQILVVAQFVITQTLIIVSIVISYQMKYFLDKDLGFNKEGVLTVRTYTPDSKQIDRLTQGLESIPEISSFSLNSGPPLDGGRYGTSFEEVGHESKGDINCSNKFVDHRYLDNYEIELVAGRYFRKDEIGDSIGGFVVNEALVNLLEVDNPQEAIGKLINCYGRKAPIIGVTEDFHTDSFSKEIGPNILLPLQRQVNGADIKIAPKNIASTMSKLEPIWLEVFPTRAFEFRSVNDTMLEIYLVEDIMMKCVRIFSLIAIIIGCLGLYGLVSFLAIKKTKEIGIRKVLGASYGQILYIFSRRFFILITIAFVISAPLAYLSMEAWLGNYAYRIDLGWVIFAIGFLTTLILTSITTGYISMKAARKNPADTLQFE